MSTIIRRYGNSKTIKWSGDITSLGYEDNLGAYKKPPLVDVTTEAHPSFTISSVVGGVAGEGVHNFGHITGPPQKQTLGPTVTATALTVTVTGSNPHDYKVDGTEVVSIPLNGSWSITADCEEYHEYEIHEIGRAHV